MVGYTLKQGVKSSITGLIVTSDYHKQLKQNTILFSNLCNIISLMGGELKRDQKVSGLMADMFSQIYMGMGILYSKDKYDLDDRLYDICLAELNNEFHNTFTNLKPHLGTSFRLLVNITCRTPNKNLISRDDLGYMSNVVWDSVKVQEYVEDKIYIKDNVLGKIRGAMTEEDAFKKNELIQDIISVGEFANQTSSS